MMINKIEIIQENYEKILEIAKISNSKTDLCNKLGYYKDGRKLEKLTDLLKNNNFEFIFSPQLSLQKHSVFNDEIKLKNVVIQSFSFSDVCRAFNVKCASSNFNTLKKYIQEFEINIEHFTHYRKESQKNSVIYYSEENLFIENSKASRNTVKNRILKDNLIPYICFNKECGNNGVWLGIKIALQLEHINGINTDNRLENLCFLCPNCHAITKTWCGKNTKYKIKLK